MIKARLPVIGAPMFLASGVDLVIAQCRAGIIGTFPTLNARPQEELDCWLTRIEEGLCKAEAETGRRPAPYGVNLMVHDSNARLAEDIEVIAARRVPLVSNHVTTTTGFGGGAGARVWRTGVPRRDQCAPCPKGCECGVDGRSSFARALAGMPADSSFRADRGSAAVLPRCSGAIGHHFRRRSSGGRGHRIMISPT